MRAFFTLCAVAALLFLAGCQEYHARSLNPNLIVADVERARHAPSAVKPESGAVKPETAGSAMPEFTFARAAELLKEHSPSLKEANAEYETALALAKVRTPLPNPAVEVGPNFGFGAGVPATHRLQPVGSIGFTIPTGRRLKRQDELNRMLAEQARAELLIRHRELYLKLRLLYVQTALAQLRVAIRKDISESAEKSLGVMKKLQDLGNATALDYGLLELDSSRLKIEILNVDTDTSGVLSDLSELVGVHSEQFQVLPKTALPTIPEKLPALAELQESLAVNHPQLARLRLAYEVTERQLRLEIAKQYPDFHFGPTFGRETSSKKNEIGLTLGIDLPIFDKNQQAIATACQKREEIRSKYEAAANRALAQLDKAYRNYNLAREKLALLTTVLQPRAKANIEQARKGLQTGVTDALKYLETERSQRVVLIDAIDTELAVRRSLVDLEQAVGYPLFVFPTENPSDQPAAVQLDAFESPCTPQNSEVQK